MVKNNIIFLLICVILTGCSSNVSHEANGKGVSTKEIDAFHSKANATFDNFLKQRKAQREQEAKEKRISNMPEQKKTKMINFTGRYETEGMVNLFNQQDMFESGLNRETGEYEKLIINGRELPINLYTLYGMLNEIVASCDYNEQCVRNVYSGAINLLSLINDKRIKQTEFNDIFMNEIFKFMRIPIMTKGYF